MKYFENKKSNESKKYNLLSLDNPNVVYEIERKNYQEYLKEKGEEKKNNIQIDSSNLEKVFTNKIHQKAMKEVSEDEKEVLCLYVLERKPIEEISKTLNKSNAEIIHLKVQAGKHFKENINNYKSEKLKKIGGVLDE